ncbi:MAG: DUF87 domain-containing protein [bacterium]|nr:DUF87 domain-containing protein [bacterium]
MNNQLYLGKLVSGNELKEKFYLNPSDFVTHSICLGMTGSGKTGLCIGLLEEMAEEGIPLLIIDPKGDLCNLSLMFSDQNPSDFYPHIDENQIQVQGKTRDQLAQEIAQTWKQGLASWDIDSSYINEIKNKSTVRIFTPGSSVGIPLNLLSDLNKDPKLDFDLDGEVLFEKIKGLSVALLNLLGIENVDQTMKEYLLLVNLFEWYWRNNHPLDIVTLIQGIIKPPFDKIGVMDIDSIYPKKDRDDLAIKINSLIANPSFKVWLEGIPVDMNKILYTESGKPSISVIYTAHLKQNERMFVTSILLYNLISWMRSQSGTGGLRAFLYLDEVFGYIPPYPQNPPTKEPLLILLKQARAFGVGVHLTTQNPVDIDYKAFTNSGIWMIGKLQTDNDKQRLADGLKSENIENIEFLDLISGLKKRQFVIKNVHKNQTVLVNSRWAISYLRGPMTLRDIKEIKKEVKTEGYVSHNLPEQKSGEEGVQILKPDVSAEFKEMFVPGTNPNAEFYHPYLFILADIMYDSKKPQFFSKKKVGLEIDVAEESNLEISNIFDNPALPASGEIKKIKYKSISDSVTNKTLYNRLKTRITNELIEKQTLKILFNQKLNIYSEPGEPVESFLRKSEDAVNKLVSENELKIRDKYDKKLYKLEEKLLKKKTELEANEDNLAGKKREEGLSAVESVFSVISRKKPGAAFSKASRKRSMTTAAQNKVDKTKHDIELINKEVTVLKTKFEQELQHLRDSFNHYKDSYIEVPIKPKKTDIYLQETIILWKTE